jgi:ABC-2 type transport system ATP-binding protein
VIEVERLVKRYGAHLAVDGVDLQARPGEVVALLGPNGAGKSTTIRAITGLLRPTAGRVLVCGHDVVRAPLAAKARLGYVPDRPYLYPKLTARELLRFVGGSAASRTATAGPTPGSRRSRWRRWPTS